VVFGQGSIGLAIGQLARARGAGAVIAVARRQETLDAAKACGADLAVSSDDAGFADVLRELEREQRVDVAFDAASGPAEVGLSGLATLGWAFQVARPEGRVVVASALAVPVSLDLQIMQRKALSMIFPRQRPSPRTLTEVVERFATSAITMRPGVSHVFNGLDTVPQAFEVTAHKNEHGAVLAAQVVV
jgi:threonine dehydrogenase-like Zn-dependent dehydrogenase